MYALHNSPDFEATPSNQDTLTGPKGGQVYYCIVQIHP